MDSHMDSELRSEARYICDSLFGIDGDSVYIDQYVAAHTHVLANGSTDQAGTVHKIVQRNLDVSACELILRRKNHVLTKKVWLLTYLVESQGEKQDLFIARGDITRFAFVAQLSRELAVTLWKMLKGRWQVWRYDLV